MTEPQTAPAPSPKSRSGSEARQRQHAVRVRLDEAERTELETRAGGSGLSLAAFMRASSFGDAGPRARRRTPVDRDLLARTNAELNRVGNNLNQITRALNEIALNDVDSPRDRLAQLVAELDQPTRAGMAELTDVLRNIRRALGYDSQG